MSRRIVLVAAVARNGVIGNGPDIPWKVPGEQTAFKHLTMGHTLVMGRTTYESIGRPLPGRTTVVLTRDPSWSPGAEGVHVAHSLGFPPSHPWVALTNIPLANLFPSLDSIVNDGG